MIAARVLQGGPSRGDVFAGAGAQGRLLAPLGWWLNDIALAVTVLVTILVVVAVVRRHHGEPKLTEDGEARAVRWIVGAVVATTVILFVMSVYTARVLTENANALHGAVLTVRVTGYRYWWKFEYLGSDGHTDFVTANELHMPTGQRVQLLLDGGDVIHSFWVPALGGKIDLVPGQTNRMWLEADSAGDYHGSCAEFCGTEHALMRILIVAERADAFARWEALQRQPAADSSAQALALIRAHGCASCHAIAGTDARGDAGPDLTHVGGRKTLAAGAINNNPQELARWLATPDLVKPGSYMPSTGLDTAEVATLVHYLRTLK
ncbi:MAG: cytochrome c oxidase subunit II [Gemmatimonadaceae bacterium]